MKKHDAERKLAKRWRDSKKFMSGARWSKPQIEQISAVRSVPLVINRIG